jgi:hypothetical protein
VTVPVQEPEPASPPASPDAPTPVPLPPAPEQLPGPPRTAASWARGRDARGAGIGFGSNGARRGLFGRVADKMAVSSNSDGSVTIRPEGDASLQILGDPLSGAISVVEIVPEPLDVIEP